jgi:hypothetical protein
MRFDNLKELPREQLVILAAKQGLSVHHKAKPETIIKQIMDNLTPQKPQVSQEKDVAKEKKEVKNTETQIVALLEEAKQRQPKLEWEINAEERTFHARCAGAEACFNWDQPLTVIQRHLTLHVLRGAMRPRAINEHFDQLHNSPKNAYTGNVLTA